MTGDGVAAAAPADAGAARPAAAALPLVIGHRGARAHAPENTLAGIRCAAELGAPWVEFDVKLTADGRCVLYHDRTLKRTTQVRGRVADSSFAAMSRLDAGGGFGTAFAGERVPRLDAALRLVLELDLGVDIEIKPSPGAERATAEAAVAEALGVWPADRAPPLISSFRPVCLAVARARAPAWPRAVIARRVPRDWRRRLAAADACILACRERYLTRRQVAELAAAGVAVMAFTVNDARRAATLWRWGVATLISDAPDVILAAAAAAGHDRGARAGI